MTFAEELSPTVLVAPIRTGLPFGLTWGDLVEILGPVQVDRPPQVEITHQRRGRHQGGRPAVIITVTVPTAEDPGSPMSPGTRARSTTIFCKLNADQTREGGAYRLLAAHGVAVPDLLVWVERPDEEVLGLEFLPVVGFGADQVEEVLQLLVSLHRVRDVPPQISTPPAGMDQHAFEQLLVTALGEVERRWPACRASDWLAGYRTALPDYERLPVVLSHGELAPQQLGRTTDHRLVVFDLETIGERPRMSDIADLGGLLARLSGRSDAALLHRYLDLLVAAGGPELERGAAWAEFSLTRFVRGIESLPWQLGLEEPAELELLVQTIAADHRTVTGLARPDDSPRQA